MGQELGIDVTLSYSLVTGCVIFVEATLLWTVVRFKDCKGTVVYDGLYAAAGLWGLCCGHAHSGILALWLGGWLCVYV